MLNHQWKPCATLVRAMSTRAAVSANGAHISAPSTAAASDQDAAALGRFFYRNRMVNQWGALPARRTTLQQLIMFGRSARRNRALLMESANYLRTEMTRRIAHRLIDMQSIPFVAMSNEQLDSIYQFHWRTFETLRRIDIIDTVEANEHLIRVVTELLSERKSKLELIAGISRECVLYMEPDAVNYFLARMLRSQISREVLAKQHIALTMMQSPDAKSHASRTTIGMVDTQLNVGESVRRSVWYARESIASIHGWDINDRRIPEVKILGDVNTYIAYLPAHLDFILLELLKVSMQSTMHFHNLQDKDGADFVVPPIKLRIVNSPDYSDIEIRISDEGGGFQIAKGTRNLSNEAIRARGPLLMPGIEQVNGDFNTGLAWSFINIGEQLDRMNIQLEETATADISRNSVDGAVTPDPTASYPGGDGLMRLSVLNMESKNGLPIVNLYAELFGGALDFRSMDGFGNNVYLRLPKLGTGKEQHE